MLHRFSFPLLALTSLIVCLLSGCATTAPTYNQGETLSGMASWYGAEQGHATASGERFNPHLLTAAHRHLPFGTIIRVTNMDNGLSVDVRINDRGPYDRDRILDVSSAAADIIQMKKAGVVPVELEILSLGSPAPRATVVTGQ